MLIVEPYMLCIKEMLPKNQALCVCRYCPNTYTVSIYAASKSRLGNMCKSCKKILPNMTTLTQADLCKVFTYEKDTGIVRMRIPTSQKSIGEQIGYAHTLGYLSCLIGKKEYLLHRVIWLMETGCWPTQIDHINHNRADNRWVNLRDVVSRDNQLNTSLKRNNTSGVNGVRILPSGRFAAFIMVNRVQISLGTYDLIDDAKQARLQADVKYGFHANHGL